MLSPEDSLPRPKEKLRHKARILCWSATARSLICQFQKPAVLEHERKRKISCDHGQHESTGVSNTLLEGERLYQSSNQSFVLHALARAASADAPIASTYIK
eukprot:1137155-Pelagomonas_calceolata.AAC.2